MRITVTGPTLGLTTQMRAYAEYQVFMRLAPLARRIGVVNVVLTTAGGDAQATCAVTADLREAGSVSAREHSHQPIEAIDRAASALADAARQRLRRQ